LLDEISKLLYVASYSKANIKIASVKIHQKGLELFGLFIAT